MCTRLTLFRIFFAVLLKDALETKLNSFPLDLVLMQVLKASRLRTRSDEKQFNLSRLKAITKTQLKLLRVFLFADDAAVVAHSAKELQQMMSRFSEAYKYFGLTISLKKTRDGMGQGVPDPPAIIISNHQLEVVHDFAYLGSTISDCPSTQNSTEGLARHRPPCPA